MGTGRNTRPHARPDATPSPSFSAHAPRVRAHLKQLLGADAVLALPSAPGPAPPPGLPGPQLDDWRARVMSLTCIAGLGALPQASGRGEAARVPAARLLAAPARVALEHCAGVYLALIRARPRPPALHGAAAPVSCVESPDQLCSHTSKRCACRAAPGAAGRLLLPPLLLQPFPKRRQTHNAPTRPLKTQPSQISMPLARVGGLPVGLSLIGPPGSDESLLELAEKIAAAASDT